MTAEGGIPGPGESEARLDEWRTYLSARATIGAADVDELEAHLRDEMDRLQSGGLSADEAFLVAVGRLGRVDDLSREFAREHSGRLWKQLVLADSATAPGGSGLGVALGLAALAAVAVKLPSLVAWATGQTAPGIDANVPLLVLPFLAAWFVWLRRPSPAAIGIAAGAFVVGALALNLYPFVPDGMTWLLTAIHLPVVLWLVIGVLYTGGDWRTSAARMDYMRFTGEWVVYMALLALGGGVLVGLTAAVFGAVGIEVAGALGDWVLPCGAAGAVVVAAWLVEAKQSVIENIAPVLTKVFTPLFAVMLVAFAATTLWQPDIVRTDRELLIVFDLVLVVVVGLVLYAVSSRDPLAAPGWFDRIQAVLVGSAVLVDAIVLIAMIARIGAFGATANKVASLGLNAILLVNLVWSLVMLVRALRGRATFAPLERWQTTCVPVYAAWAAVVALAFPPVFGFV